MNVINFGSKDVGGYTDEIRPTDGENYLNGVEWDHREAMYSARAASGQRRGELSAKYN